MMINYWNRDNLCTMHNSVTIKISETNDKQLAKQTKKKNEKITELEKSVTGTRVTVTANDMTLESHSRLSVACLP